jgi:predicted membrane protein
MRNQRRIVVGIVIIVVGLAWLLGGVFHVDVGLFCLPLVLILLGIYILIRPTMVRPNTALQVTVFGPVRRDTDWQVTDQEIWLFVGDIRLDLTQAQIPKGETLMRVYGFVGNVKVRIPADVGVSIASTAFVSTIRAFGEKREILVAPAHQASEGYEAAERRIRLELFLFVSEVKVEQV